MLNNFKLHLTVCIGFILFTNYSCSNNKSNQQAIQEKNNSGDSADQECKQLVAKMEEYIKNELNSCRVHSDCIVASGTCPLGPFFFVNKINEKILDSIIVEVDNTCGPCKYDMPQFPTTAMCINHKCYPGFNDRATILMLVGYKCEIIANLYREELFGKKFQNLNLNEHLYIVIQEDDIEAINSSEFEMENKVKVIVDKKGYIKALNCYQ